MSMHRIVRDNCCLPPCSTSPDRARTTLRWPRELFCREGRALLAAQPVLMKKHWMEQVELLLEEALVTAMPVADLR